MNIEMNIPAGEYPHLSQMRGRQGPDREQGARLGRWGSGGQIEGWGSWGQIGKQGVVRMQGPEREGVISKYPPGTVWHETTLTSHQSGILHSVIFLFINKIPVLLYQITFQ